MEFSTALLRAWSKPPPRLMLADAGWPARWSPVTQSAPAITLSVVPLPAQSGTRTRELRRKALQRVGAREAQRPTVRRYQVPRNRAHVLGGRLQHHDVLPRDDLGRGCGPCIGLHTCLSIWARRSTSILTSRNRHHGHHGDDKFSHRSTLQRLAVV